MARRKKSSGVGNMGGIFEALDLMLTGRHDSVVGRDFILARNSSGHLYDRPSAAGPMYDPYSPETGYIPRSELVNYDQEFVNKILDTKSRAC